MFLVCRESHDSPPCHVIMPHLLLSEEPSLNIDIGDNKLNLTCDTPFGPLSIQLFNRPDPGSTSPVTRRHLYNIYTMLEQRRRRWADVVYMLCKCFVLTGSLTGHELQGASEIYRRPRPSVFNVRHRGFESCIGKSESFENHAFLLRRRFF